MKRISLILVLCVITVLLVASYFVYLNPTTKKNVKPEALIELKKEEAGELIINQGDSIYFSAKNSTDKDGNIEKYSWDFGDGSSSDNVDSEHTYDEPGVYNVSLTVVDNDGNKDVTWMTIKVNDFPVAIAKIDNYFEPNSNRFPIYEWIFFNATDSYDPDGSFEELKFYWDFGDGKNSTITNPKHQFDAIGYFNVSLTVIDKHSGTATNSLELLIVLRTYRIEWILKQKEEVIEPNGYTLEGESTEVLSELQQVQLANVKVNLSWSDRQPFLKNNQSEGEDSFELQFITPENVSDTQNSSSGNISVGIEYRSALKEKNYDAKTADEAITIAIEDAEFTDEGSGEWLFNVSALECKGGSWLDGQFDLDVGNFWNLKVIFYYFEYEITEIT